MCLNHVGGWFSKTQRDKKFDPGYWIKLLEPPCLIRMNPINRTRNHPRKPLDSAKLGASGSFVKAGDVGILETASLRYLYTP